MSQWCTDHGRPGRRGLCLHSNALDRWPRFPDMGPDCLYMTPFTIQTGQSFSSIARCHRRVLEPGFITTGLQGLEVPGGPSDSRRHKDRQGLFTGRRTVVAAPPQIFPKDIFHQNPSPSVPTQLLPWRQTEGQE